MVVRRFFSLIPALFIAFSALSGVFGARVCAADEQSVLQLTPEEERYIASHKSLRIGYVQDRIPVSFSDQNGELAGISRYIFDRVSDICGLEFEYVPLPEGEITYDYLLGNELDLVSSVEYNDENKNARGILISEPYLSSRKVVVARKGFEFKSGSRFSVAISTGSQTIKKVLAKSYPNFDPVDHPSVSACFDAVNSGEADLMIQNQYVVEYWISKPIYEKLNVIPVPGLDDRLCFSAVVAFGGGEGPDTEDGRILIDILNKTIAAIPEDEIGSYTIQAIMENPYRYTFSDFLYRYRHAVRTMAIAVFLIILLTVLLIRMHLRFTENKANDRIKNQFLSTMSHEIRTPLNGLIGLNHLMSQNSDDPEKLKEYLRQSTLTSNYLMSLVNDMFDMSSLQSQNLELVLRPVDLKLVLNTVDSITENAMSAKGIEYISDYDLVFPCVLGDEVRIQQVLLSLLDNARKFTPKGGKVTLSIKQELLYDETVLTSATVTDTGSGMSEKFQKHIFDTFAQELDTVSKGNQGTGLGLPISRRLAILMGGDLTFTSRKGEGSSFTFTFAAKPDVLPQKDVLEQPDNTKHPRILVAEDNELNGEIILSLLEEYGFEATLAENGKKALETFCSSEPHTFGVILMDLLMPEMDGFEATKAIRELKRPDAKTVRIFACTANSLPEDREKAMSSGMDDFIAKPIDVGALIRKLSTE